MNKKLPVLLFICFLLPFAFWLSVSANEGHYDPDSLLSDAEEEIYLRIGPSQDFSEDQGYLNEILDNNVIHQYFIYNGVGTDVLMSIYPVSEKVISTNRYLNFSSQPLKDFYVSLTLQHKEDIPAGTGGSCWIRYSNRLILGNNHEQGLILFPGMGAYVFSHDSEKMVADLSGLDSENPIKFDFIRIDGTVFVYANEEFIFSFEDGIQENVTFEAGSMLNKQGNRIRCDFDDFTVRF